MIEPLIINIGNDYGEQTPIEISGLLCAKTINKDLIVEYNGNTSIVTHETPNAARRSLSEIIECIKINHTQKPKTDVPVQISDFFIRLIALLNMNLCNPEEVYKKLTGENCIIDNDA